MLLHHINIIYFVHNITYIGSKADMMVKEKEVLEMDSENDTEDDKVTFMYATM